jgi:predicted pyridoxine 5'-phosphate oxidase superfamily flavin-nucleotide-binding protein
MPDQHRAFFTQLPMLLVGSVDDDGQPWASVLCAPPGFIDSPDATHLRINSHPLKDDPLNTTLAAGCALGLLGIELPTRRRNRANGVVQFMGADGFTLEVRESFGNCAKYIQTRTPRFAEPAPAVSTPAKRAECTDRLNERMRQIIGGTDTYFIASAYSGHDRRFISADVSHRGGRPGFVRIDNATTLTVPEFVGNSYFNTTGNLLTHPRAGLLFIDFPSGDLLHLAADTEIIWDGREVERY